MLEIDVPESKPVVQGGCRVTQRHPVAMRQPDGDRAHAMTLLDVRRGPRSPGDVRPVPHPHQKAAAHCCGEVAIGVTAGERLTPKEHPEVVKLTELDHARHGANGKRHNESALSLPVESRPGSAACAVKAGRAGLSSHFGTTS